MTDTLQTLALITVAQNYAGDVVRQVNRTCSTLRFIPIRVAEGKNIAWVAQSSGQLAEYYAEGADAANFGSDAQAPATLNLALVRANFHVSGLARAAARTSATPLGNINLWARNLVDGTAALAAKVNAGLFSGDGAGSPKEITGLDQAIGSASNTYATIDRSSASYWRPTLANPGAGTDLTLAQIRGDLKDIYVASGEYPDVAVCHPAVMLKLAGLFDANRNYMQNVDTVKTARGTVTLDAGFQSIKVDGCTFVADKDATLESGGTSGRIYYLNTGNVDLMVLPQDDAPGLGPDMMLQANDGFGAIPLMVGYEMLAKTGDSAKAEAKVYCELRVRRPNSCGVRRFVNI